MAKIKVISRKELIAFTKINPTTLRSHIYRGIIKETKEKGFINVYNATNQDWIVDHCSKKGIDIRPIFNQNGVSVPRKEQSEQAKKVSETLKKEQEIQLPIVSTEHTRLRDSKLREEIQSKEIETQLKKLELEKKKAKVLPTDFVVEVLSSYIKTNIAGIKTDGHKTIDSIVDELGGDHSTKLKFKKQFDIMVSDTFKNNHESITKEAKKKAKKYAADRNW
jgi:hypothetical protein